MIEYHFQLDNARIFRQLRFGMDDPCCEVCGQDDIFTLCGITKPNQTEETIICHNCRDRAKQPTQKALRAKAKRFADAGYFAPACIICNDSTLQILEVEHAFNAANSDVVSPMCGNHHAIKSAQAEVGPMAALRLREPNRRALVLQAAFELGGASIIGMIAVWDGAHDQQPRAIFLGLLSVGLFLWAVWNLKADLSLADAYGIDYDRILPIAPTIELDPSAPGLH